MPSDPVAERWRNLFLQAVEPVAHHPLLLSGGMDSVTILVAQRALGHRPLCVAFTIGGQDNADTRAARHAADALDVPLDVVDLPRDVDRLAADIRRLSRSLTGPPRKAVIQCAQPVMWMAEHLAAAGHGDALIGTGGIVEDNRKCAVLLHQQGEDAARELRRSNLLDWHNSATGAMIATGAAFGVALHQPYTHQPFADYSLSLDMAEVNRPRQKGVALRAFPEVFTRYPLWRANQPLQMGTSLREWHDTLLNSPYNRRGSKAVIGVYRDLVKDVHDVASATH